MNKKSDDFSLLTGILSGYEDQELTLFARSPVNDLQCSNNFNFEEIGLPNNTGII